MGIRWNDFATGASGVTDSGVADESSLKNRLLAWIRGENSGLTFESMALEVFVHQFSKNPPYRRYCEALGRTVENVTDWREIPALPTDAFKFPAHLPRSFDASRASRHFLTSGTTTDVRGRHEFEDLDLYEASIIEGWRQLGLPEFSNPWFLSQTPAVSSESSLVHMFEVLDRESGGEGHWMIDKSARIDSQGMESEKQVQLFSTALALLRWMESGEKQRLPEGSWVFETGGYKGLRETLAPEAFRAQLSEFLNIPANRILNEYSMTELSSQFYRWPDEPAHRGPTWTRIRVIDPQTGTPAADGQPGYLEIVDLANLGSVAAIRTQDLAIATGDSEFVLLGRDPGALPRGCSRSSDDLLQKR